MRGLLALNNEHAVQIDGHDTLWGETGTFSSLSFFPLCRSHCVITHCCVSHGHYCWNCVPVQSSISCLHHNTLPGWWSSSHLPKYVVISTACSISLAVPFPPSPHKHSPVKVSFWHSSRWSGISLSSKRANGVIFSFRAEWRACSLPSQHNVHLGQVLCLEFTSSHTLSAHALVLGEVWPEHPFQLKILVESLIVKHFKERKQCFRVVV